MIQLLVILIIVLVGFVPSVFAHATTSIVKMNENGFEPKELAVDENTTVLFVNDDSKPHWPASNVHPTHDIYRQFDPRKPIEPGGSWPFKPSRVGTFKYHDHLLPHFRGVLTVEKEGSGKNQSDKVSIITKLNNAFNGLLSKIKNFFNVKAIFSSQTDHQKKLAKEVFKQLSEPQQADEVRKISQSLGAAKAWEYVKEVFEGEAGSSGNIHDLSHLSGILIYDKLGFEGIKSCSPEFAFGCFHGFLDQAFKEDLNHLLDAQAACLKLGPDSSGPVASCIHGIGHGVASFYSTDNLKASLSSCRKLDTGREYCFDGVFMEFVRSAPQAFFKKDNPLYPCDALEKEFGPTYSFSCGRNTPSLLMSRFSMAFGEVVGVCLNARSKPFKEACFDALGFSLAATADSRQIITGCQGIGALEFIARCARAAAGELVFQEVPNWQDKSEEVCNAFPKEADGCLSYVNGLIKEYGRVKRVNFTPFEEGEDLNQYVREQMKVCFEIDGAGGCYKQVAQFLYEKFGLFKTLALIKENEDYPEVYARCHEVTHYLSRFEYEKLGSIAKVYAQCDSTCHGGCYHGTLEAFLKQKEERFGANLPKEFAKVCGKKDDYQKPLEFNECLHGMGHAAMFVTEMELRQSLSLCDSFSDQDHKERCYSGVFMENSSSSTSFDHKSIYLKADDPYFPCNSLEERYLPLCWQYQSSYFAIISNQDWNKVAVMCLQIPAPYQDLCFKTIGTNQVGFTSSLERMKDDCELMPTQFRDTCVAGVISSLTYRFVGDLEKMIRFCSIVNPNNQESCYKQVGTGFLDWSTDRNLARQQCSKIPEPKGQNWCMMVI